MVTPTDRVSADEWRSILQDPEFLLRVRRAAALPRTNMATGIFLTFRQIGGSEIRYTRVYEHDPDLSESATTHLYEDIPELYSDPILFLIEAHGLERGPAAPTHRDLHGLLSFVSAKGFTQMPVGIWIHQSADTDPIAVFLAQWRGYPSLDQWESVEAAFEADAVTSPGELADALNATGIVFAHIDTVPAEQGTLQSLDIAEHLAYDLVTYGEPGGGFMAGPVN